MIILFYAMWDIIENVLKIHKIFENGVNFNRNNKKSHIPRPQHRHCIFFQFRVSLTLLIFIF